jgi:hypothetical protein
VQEANFKTISLNCATTEFQPRIQAKSTNEAQGFTIRVFSRHSRPNKAQLRMSRPTIEADMRLAMVPAIMARKPSLAN